MSARAPARLRRRTRVRVYGTVQGVGFRPYVYRLAGELGLSGFVRNDSRGVVLEVEGPDRDVERFLARLGPGETEALATVFRRFSPEGAAACTETAGAQPADV